MSQTKAELVNGLSVNTALDDAVTIDSTGKATFTTPGGDDAVLVKGDTFTGVRIQAARDDSSDHAMFQMLGSRGTNASPTIVQNGDTLGTLTARGYDGNSYAASSNIKFGIDGTPGDGDMPGRITFNTSADGSQAPTERLRIDSSGKVGIGTTSPSQQLTLVSSGDSKINIKGHGSSTGYFIGMPSATNAQVWNAENGYIQIASNDTERIRVNASGSVLFHQTTSEVPGLANTVVGSCFEKVGTNGSALFVSRADSFSLFLNRNNTGEIVSFRQSGTQVGTISTNGNSLPSDRNFKKNITDLTLGLDFINTLKPSKFNLKLEEDADPLLFGLIAQDVEESLTAAGVTKNSTVLCQHKPTESETESDYNLDYIKLIPILINSIKELSTKVAALEAA